MSTSHGEAHSLVHECGNTPVAESCAADMPGSGVQACATTSPITPRLASAASAALFGMPRSGELARVIKDIRKHRRVGEEWIARYQCGERAAGTVLLLAHAPLVAHIARRYCRPEHRDWDDCLQQGSLGILKAAECFDASKNAAPSTYIVIWIRNRIRRWLQECAQGVRIPVHQYDKKPDGTQAKLGSPRTRTFSSMAQTHHERSDLEFEDTLVDQSELTEDVYAEAEQAERVGTVATWFLSKLTPMQAEVLRRRNGDPEETLKEIGDDHDRTRERIRQIESEALERCRRLAARRGADPEKCETFGAWLPKIVDVVMRDSTEAA